MNPQEETLMECLSACGLRELPPKIDADDNRTWLRAIALCTKVGGVKNFVLCENDGKGHPNIKRDFGRSACIVFIDSIHPFEFADKTIVPTFKDDAEIIHYLSKSKYDRAEIEALLKAGDREEIQRRIHAVAMAAQKSKIAERKRVDEIKEFAQKAKAEKESRKTRSTKKKANGNDNNKA